MTKIGPKAPDVPAPVSTGAAEAASQADTLESTPPIASAPSFDPTTTAAGQRPPVLAPTLGDKRTDGALASLTSSAQLIANQRSSVSPDESLSAAHAALTRARNTFKPESGERKMSESLLLYLQESDRASPAQTAVSLVVQSIPDYQSRAHGAFKEVARAIDAATSDRAKGKSETALQVVFGFVPGLGTALDVRDLLQALDSLHDHKDGAGFDVAIAGVAFIPGLDCLKAGKTAAGKKALREAAEGLSEVAKDGLKVLATKVGDEAAAIAERQVRSFNVLRTETIARIDASIAQVPQNLAGLLDSARSALRKSAKPDDLVGAMRDVAGVPVPKKMSNEVFNHFNEVSEALDSVANALRSKELSSSEARYFLETALQDCRKALKAIIGET